FRTLKSFVPACVFGTLFVNEYSGNSEIFITMKQLLQFLLFSVLLLPSLQAQQSLNQVLTDWYLEERFILADQDKDALLDKDELKQFPQEFGYYLDSRNFGLTDLDKDGKLSFRETKSRVLVEFNFRYAKELSALATLEKQYPALAQPTLETLKANPSLTAALMGNLYWMNSNADLAKAIYQDREWMQSQSEVLASLQRNLCWLITHPSDAKQLYKSLKLSRKAPEMMSWRSAHKTLLRRYEDLPEDIVLSFLPKE
ncbi:MAG: hypothetical protein AB8F95_11640, partial [Bacteroidia bacterium]